ncbi:MAG: MerR family transcriptional regulator [Myxococcota bacterium]
MPGETWTWEELFEGLDPAPSFVSELERLGLLRVVARDADGRALYAREAREELEKVLSLVDLGYQPKDIAAIARKVGLPSPRPRRLFRKPPTYVRVDELARRSGAPLERVRAWVDEGLVEADLVSEGGERHFAPATVEQVRLLDDLVTLGLGPDDVARWARALGGLRTLRSDDDGEQSEEEIADLRRDLVEEAEALLPGLGERLDRARAAVRRWDKTLAGLRKRLARERRSERVGRTGRRRRVRTRSRGRKGPGSED